MLTLWKILVVCSVVCFQHANTGFVYDDSCIVYKASDDECKAHGEVAKTITTKCDYKWDEFETLANKTDKPEDDFNASGEKLEKANKRIGGTRCVWKELMSQSSLLKVTWEKCQQLHPDSDNKYCTPEDGVKFFCNAKSVFCTLISVNKACPNAEKTILTP